MGLLGPLCAEKSVQYSKPISKMHDQGENKAVFPKLKRNSHIEETRFQSVSSNTFPLSSLLSGIPATSRNILDYLISTNALRKGNGVLLAIWSWASTIARKTTREKCVWGS